ncbi:MAG: amidase [Caulobacterales bacterium]|nr:amidase [Caulobacterales bacterium]
MAARLCAAALGTDTLGSVRIPAGFCGVFGFKPNHGCIPDMGLGYLSWTLDTIGPLARRAEDLRALTLALAQPHADAWAQAPWANWREYWIDDPVPWGDLVVGVIELDVEVEEGVAAVFETARATVEGLGAAVRPLRPAIPADISLRRTGLLISEAEGAVAFAQERSAGGEELSAEFAKLLDWGAKQSAERLAGAQFALRQARAAITRQMRDEGVDLLISPTAPQAPGDHGPPAPVSQADFTSLANIADMPAVSIPIGQAEGRPVGMQVICPGHDDALALRVARQLEEVFGPPPIAPV